MVVTTTCTILLIFFFLFFCLSTISWREDVFIRYLFIYGKLKHAEELITALISRFHFVLIFNNCGCFFSFFFFATIYNEKNNLMICKMIRNIIVYNIINERVMIVHKCSFISFNYYTNETILITLALNIVIIPALENCASIYNSRKRSLSISSKNKIERRIYLTIMCNEWNVRSVQRGRRFDEGKGLPLFEELKFLPGGPFHGLESQEARRRSSQ